MRHTEAELRHQILARLTPGPFMPDANLLALLEAYWDARGVAFGTKMAPYKAGRIEEAWWNPPVLEFRITRHPSPWFRKQKWSYNFETDRATLAGEWGERKNQPYTRDQRRADAEAIAGAVREGQPHPAVRYQGDIVTIDLARLPATRPQAYVLPKRTAQGRQQALKAEVDGFLAAEHGFARLPDRERRATLVYRRSAPPGAQGTR
ncbi:MAG: hypothetical protein HY689_09030 [Chloroflexi bacterium]|nr:hypothetical protein [Chloroflexota bacterium]